MLLFRPTRLPLMPAKAGIQAFWVPAFAGTSGRHTIGERRSSIDGVPSEGGLARRFHFSFSISAIAAAGARTLAPEIM
jgi:hypothetical protein